MKSKMIVQPKQAQMMIQGGMTVHVCYKKGSVQTYGQECQSIEQLDAALEVKGFGAPMIYVETKGTA